MKHLIKPFLSLTIVATVFVSTWYINQLAKLNNVILIAHAQHQLPIPRTPAYQRLRPALLPVCSCESSYEGNSTSIPQQFERDGRVRYGRANAQDRGMCQINEHYHKADSIRLGMDIETEEGNVAFANHLYDTQGLAPWIWSKATCWGKEAKN